MSGTRRDAPPHHKHNDSVPDAGLRSLDHYKRALPKWRYNLRQQALPLIRWETPYLAALQSKLRTPALDSYFAITANLGTHTFFMVFLPMLFWGGYAAFAKGLVHILALGVFWTGFIKDFYSLPRPLSPPLNRITMSGSAALEYGFPSTHSANAVSVAVYAILHLRDPLNTFSDTTKLLLEILSYFYAVSIVFGRLYCGMHGFLDVIIGSIMGVGITVLEYYYGPPLDAAMQHGTWLVPVIAGLVVVIFVRIHPEPADDCPCFDDSVAFAGVVIGLEAGTWTVGRTFLADAESSMGVLPYVSWVIPARMVVGIIAIFVWRETMKPTLLKVLPHIFRLIESTGFDLPRRFFTPASEYKSVPPGSRLDTLFPTASDFPRMVESIRHPTTRGRSVSIGPQSAADAYETLAYRERQRRDSIGSNASLKSKSSNMDLNGKEEDKSGKGAQTSGAQKAGFNDNESLRGPNDILVMQGTENGNPDIYLSMEDARDEKEVFSQLVKPRVRYDVEVVTKLVVYAGISWLAVAGMPMVFSFIGLGVVRTVTERIAF
ncbi:acid phosphatase/Vanadium-dependent haloperoxidase [Trichoderma velutinum]